MSRFAAALAVASLIPSATRAQDAPPQDCAVPGSGLPWVEALAWKTVVGIREAAGATWDERLESAQKALAEKGGVVYFPAGAYEFKEHLRLRSGIVLRGATPPAGVDARDANYDPPTRFVFPVYKPVFEGDGAPTNAAFKGVRLDDPDSGHDAGLVNIAVDHGHVHFGATGKDFETNFAQGRGPRNLLVYGCVFRNAAIPDSAIPMRKHPKSGDPFQEPWQRWTQRHHAAIHVFAFANVLVMNNRIPESGQDNFVMKGYKLYNETGESEGIRDPARLKVLTADVTFDYDNRAGIYVNTVSAGKGLELWNAFGTPNAVALPEPPPHALAKGLVIRGNFVFCTGSCAVNVTGDGVAVLNNVIRYAKGVVRITARGHQFDHFTNNNRAIEVRGWRWTVEGNDYEVHSNVSAKGARYGDGEGIMHEAFNNCDVRDSRLVGNKGNAYLCLWRVPVDGLLVQSNTVPNVTVRSATNRKVPLPVRRVHILDNTLTGSTGMGEIRNGIEIIGGPAQDNVIRGNRAVPAGAKIVNTVGAVEDANEGFGAPK